MAKQIVTLLTDDIDGGEADRTIEFGLDGVNYTIDLSDKNAGKLRKGSFLVVLGNPFNAARDGKASASWGILSNVARRVELDLDDFQFPRQASPQLPNYPTLLQLDAKLNLGMSGGAVVNM